MVFWTNLHLILLHLSLNYTEENAVCVWDVNCLKVFVFKSVFHFKNKLKLDKYTIVYDSGS